MQFVEIVKVLVLLMMANGTPVILKRIMGDRFAYPLDAGARFPDGRPVFGPSKTLRGLISSLLITTLVAPALGLDWRIGLVIDRLDPDIGRDVARLQGAQHLVDEHAVADLDGDLG